MNKKIELDAQELSDWMCNHWNLYSSQTHDGKLLRLWINCNGTYRTVHGGEILYEGSQMTHAIAAWDSTQRRN